MEKELRQAIIFRDMNYEQIRTDIMNGDLSVNINIKLRKKYQKLYFQEITRSKFCELTILHLAICLDDEEFVDHLLRKDADVNLGTEHLGPVIFSTIRLQKLKYVRKLVDAGAKINERVSLYGLEQDRVIIRSYNPDDNVSGLIHHYNNYTSLAFAVNSNAYEIVEFLISRGAEVNYEDLWGDSASPLGYAATSNHVKMMNLLMNCGADINFIDSDGYHYSSLLAVVSNYENIDSVKFLVNQPIININIVDHDKCSCLHLVAGEMVYNNYESFHQIMLPCLLNAGCDVNLVNLKKELAVDIITEENSERIMVIKEHIIKLISVNEYVCARNVEVVSEPEFDLFRTNCYQEIKLLKKIQEPNTRFPYYYLLKIDQHKLALRLKNCNIYNFDHLRSEMPLYGGMIAYKLEQAALRCKLFKEVENSLYEVFHNLLPATFIHKVFFHLSYVDLLKLNN